VSSARPRPHTALASIIICALAAGLAAQPPARPAPTPVDPFTAIIDAFRSHDLVTISDAHGSKTVNDFWNTLIRDPRLPGVVNDIVIEGGNARFQALIDRYTSGDDVPYDELRQVWNDTTVANSEYRPRDGVVPDRFRVIREVNLKLPRERQLRALLGDPPIDWSQVKTPADAQWFFNLRDSHPAALIQREVLARHHKALLMYGEGHAQRRNQGSNYDMSVWQAQTIVSILESTTPMRIFSIHHSTELTKVFDVAKWPVPSLAIVRGTTLGAIDYAAFGEGIPRAKIVDGKIVRLPREEWKVLPLEENFDAELHLGPDMPGDPPPAASAVCSDPFLPERLRRLELGGSSPISQQIRRTCGMN
jgi:hypothetical protein